MKQVKKNTIYVKNMVCPRCIDSVKGILSELDIEVNTIVLGRIELHKPIDSSQQSELAQKLEEKGFELLKEHNLQLISCIKSIVIDYIRNEEALPKINFSSILTGKLNQDYSSLSRTFSSVEGITIERYIVKQKIERVKELIFYSELTLSEIAFKMHYSSVAYLSSQFKKETGMTPTAFKMQKKPGHQPLDSL